MKNTDDYFEDFYKNHLIGQWISVKDELPPPGLLVVVASDRCIHLGSFSHHSKTWNTGPEGHREILYWLLLPQYPDYVGDSK